MVIEPRAAVNWVFDDLSELCDSMECRHDG
jgi:hypothetical protein